MSEENKPKATYKGRVSTKLANCTIMRTEFDKEGKSVYSVSIEVPVDLMQAPVVPENVRTDAQVSFLKYHTMNLTQADEAVLLDFLQESLKLQNPGKK